jgi:glycosyltransferase involved in cell wall biosynthesis
MRPVPHKKILFIVQHRLNRSPGQRYRCEQYVPYLRQQGFECTYSPVIVDAEEDQALYRSINLLDKAGIFIKSFARRIRDVWRASHYDIVFIYREAFPIGWVFFERLLKLTGATIVLDFDDAIWLPTVSEVNRSLQWLKNPEKINKIITLSNLVIVGNTYLGAYAKRFNKKVVVFPSTINLDYYKFPLAQSAAKNSGKIIIGWSGSHTTIEHFEIITPVLKKLKEKYGDNVIFKVYGDPDYRNDSLGIVGTAWSHESEVEVIGSFDIGIMPLPDNEWSKGKCAMKGLLYMGMGVPAVLAAVGMNTDVINDGVTGFLAANDEEWFNKLSLLIENNDLRKKIGLAGRSVVEKSFSCQAKHEEYVNIFLNLTA